MTSMTVVVAGPKTELPWAQRNQKIPVPRFPTKMAGVVTTERMRLSLKTEVWLKAVGWAVPLEVEPTLVYTPELHKFEDTREHHPFSGCESDKKRRKYHIH